MSYLPYPTLHLLLHFLYGLNHMDCTGLTTNETALFNASDMYGASVTLDASQSDTYKISSSGLPDHSTQKVNPNDAKHQNHQLVIPKSPEVMARKGCLEMGKIGLTRTGVSIFNPLARGFVNAVEGKFKEKFDSCDGHPAPTGDYHYHKLPDSCLWKNKTDELIGVAADGFPIYGPNVTGYADLLTTKDLDKCHGMEINGRYRYIATYDFPYILACYHGKVVDGKIRTQYVCRNTSKYDDEWGYLCSCHEYGSAVRSSVSTWSLVVMALAGFLLSPRA